jgi:hypothetical protein
MLGSHGHSPARIMRRGLARGQAAKLRAILTKLIVGACALALSFWGALTLIDHFKSSQTTASPEIDLSARGLYLFDEKNTQVSYVVMQRNAAVGPEGSRTAILLDDRSAEYGSIYDDAWVENDDRSHTFSIDLKAGTSPLTQIVMHYIGGTQKVYYAFVDISTMAARGEGTITSNSIGNGWQRITIAGANNKSGSTTLRVQIYPRHGKPEDTGSLYIANPRLDP